MKKTGSKTGAKKTGVPTSLMSQHKRMAKGEAIMKGGGSATSKANSLAKSTFGKPVSQDEFVKELSPMSRANSMDKAAFGKRISQDEFIKAMEQKAGMPKMKKGGSAHAKSCKCMACGGSAGY